MSNDVNCTFVSQNAINDIESGRSRAASGNAAAGTGGPRGSWLAVLVEALNKQVGDAWQQMQRDGNNVVKDSPETMTKFQISSQSFSLLMNTVQTVVKTIGEANSAAARKQ